MTNIYEKHLEPNPANYTPLSPVSFLRRSALAYPDKVAVIDGRQRYTYRELANRAYRLASALNRRGMGKGDTGAGMAASVPAMIEAEFGVAMAGDGLRCVNFSFDTARIGVWRCPG